MRHPLIAAAAALVLVAPAHPTAQARQPPTRSEWGQFEQLAVQPRGGLSPDGKWLAYGINRSNRENELRIRNVASGAETTIAFGGQPSFSADSQWVAYSIGVSEAQEERLRTQRRPNQRKVGMLKLDGKADPVVIDGIEAFSIDPSGAYIVLRRYAPERTPAGGGAPPPAGATPAPSTGVSADDPPPTGVTILVREFATGRDTTFGNIAEFAWQTVTDGTDLKGRLLALTISTDDKTANGIHLYDAASGSHRVLDSSSSIYAGLGWRRDADDLVVLRSQTGEARDGSTHAILAWRGVAGASPRHHALDPVKSVAAGMRTISFRRPSWSDGSGGQRRDRSLAPGSRAVQHRSAREEGCGDARVRRRRSRSTPEGEPDRLSAAHPPVVRPLPEARTCRPVDNERSELHRTGQSGEGHGPGATVGAPRHTEPSRRPSPSTIRHGV